MKLKKILCALCFIPCAWGSEVASECVWVGAGNNYKWSNVANWQDGNKPTSGAGQVVKLYSAHNGVLDTTPIEVDEDVIVGQMIFGDDATEIGKAPVTLTGSGLLSVTKDHPWEAYVTVTNYVRVGFDGTAQYIRTGRDVYFCAPVTATATSLRFRRDIGPKSGNLYFKDSVTAPNTTWHSGGSNMHTYFYGPVTFAKVNSGYNSCNGYSHFYAAGNQFPVAEVYFYGGFFAENKNVFPTNMVMSWHLSNLDDTSTSTSFYELVADQTIDRLTGEAPTNKSGDVTPGTVFCTVRSLGSTAATLTLRASKSDCTYARFDRLLSVVYDPLDPTYELQLCQRKHPTKGTLHVKRGILSSCGTNTFENLTRLTVDDGAIFRVTNCIYGDAVNPFTTNTELYMHGTGMMDVAAGVTVTFTRMFLDGIIQPAKTYQALDGTDATAEKVAWVTGKGLVKVTVCDGTCWIKKGGGVWSDAENWSNGKPDATKRAYFIDSTLGDYTVTMGDTDAWPTYLEMQGAGKVLHVTAGNEVVYNGSGQTPTILITEGACIRVDGSLKLDHFAGSCILRSSRSSVTSSVEVAGSFRYVAKDNHPLELQTGGAIVVPGGTFSITNEGTKAFSLSMKGGKVLASGTGLVWFQSQASKANFLRAGEFTFRDDAEFRWSQPSAIGSIWGALGEDEELTVNFFDRATYTGTDSDGFQIGFADYNECGDADVTIDSSVFYKGFGNRLIINGRRGGKATFRMCNGYARMGGRGMDVGYVAGKTCLYDAYTGRVEITGGAIYNTGSNGAWSDQSKQNGTIIGGGEFGANTTTNKTVYGEFDISGGAYTNQSGIFLAGFGQGVARCRQTGGLFIQNTSYPWGIGIAGGDGYYEMTNGVLKVNGTAWVGSHIATNLLTKPEKSIYWPHDMHTAEGVFAFSGGTAAFEKTLTLGSDGQGTLRRSGVLGDLVVKGNLVLSNTLQNVASGGVLEFVLDDVQGIKPVDVRGKLIVGTNARVTINLGAYKGKRGRIPLITAAKGIVTATDANATLENLDVILTGNDKLTRVCVPYLDQGTLGLEINRGTVFIVR